MISRGLLLAIDQGTTNTKAVLVGRDGRPVFVASAAVSVTHPRSDWVEQDPMALWASVEQAVAECVRAAGEQPIAAVGIANQRETVVAWDRATGEPVAPAIVWQCRRSAEICSRLEKSGSGETIRARTGLGIDPLFSASKMSWLLENVAGLRERAEAGEICFGTVDSWLIWRLTGGRVHACDASNASRTQLFNLERGMWDSETAAAVWCAAGCAAGGSGFEWIVWRVCGDCGAGGCADIKCDGGFACSVGCAWSACAGDREGHVWDWVFGDDAAAEVQRRGAWSVDYDCLAGEGADAVCVGGEYFDDRVGGALGGGVPGAGEAD